MGRIGFSARTVPGPDDADKSGFAAVNCVGNSLQQGKTQGISPNLPPFREIRLENNCDSSLCEKIPYAAAQGIFSRPQGNYSPFRPWQGKWLKIDPLAATKHLLRVVASGDAQKHSNLAIPPQPSCPPRTRSGDRPGYPGGAFGNSPADGFGCTDQSADQVRGSA